MCQCNAAVGTILNVISYTLTSLGIIIYRQLRKVHEREMA